MKAAPWTFSERPGLLYSDHGACGDGWGQEAATGHLYSHRPLSPQACEFLSAHSRMVSSLRLLLVTWRLPVLILSHFPFHYSSPLDPTGHCPQHSVPRHPSFAHSCVGCGPSAVCPALRRVPQVPSISTHHVLGAWDPGTRVRISALRFATFTKTPRLGTFLSWVLEIVFSSLLLLLPVG